MTTRQQRRNFAREVEAHGRRGKLGIVVKAPVSRTMVMAVNRQRLANGLAPFSDEWTDADLANFAQANIREIMKDAP